jgi:endonuclease-3 related protein
MTVLPLPGERLREVYASLLRAYGPQHWWPGDNPFEIMVGAILTQNTAWSNVERAIANLTGAGALSADALLAVGEGQLAEWLRPSGYFNIKAKRLRNFCAWYRQQGGFESLSGWPTDALRVGLLSVNGVGPETADDMLLYAFERPVFVIDAYTRRIFSRLGLVAGDESYEAMRLGFERALGADVPLFNEYHALLVRHGKERCRPKPDCHGCCLSRFCSRFILTGR